MKASSAKRSNKRRAKNNGTPTPVVVRLGSQPFPKQLFNTLKYAVRAQMAVTAGVGGYVICANGMFKPDPLTSTAQPLYFDQLMAVYDHYAVRASRCKFTPLVGSALNIIYGAYPDDDSTLQPTSSTNIAMLTRPDGTSSWVGNTNVSKPGAVTSRYVHKEWFGGDLLASSDQQGTSTSNPTETVFHAFQYYDIGLTSYNLDLVIQVEYDVVWDELFTVNQS
jgi:hypothetical protein